ncbi:hypothetical protein [Alkalilacustris brevis]|uniref:hypothetical protein n=1 Tax=Alkalilacustris brevis TaxID=2026338 RepID=UPI0012D3444D|nr:hypothetical protein [Alkalilacustris brevis]
MPLDRISEEIAHFIGLLHLEVEGHRLRLEYDAFAHEREDTALDPGEVPDLAITIPGFEKGFNPGVVYLPPPPAAPPAYLLAPEGLSASITLRPVQPPRPPEPDQDIPWQMTGWQFSWLPFVPLPNSILVSIRQTSELWDNDLLLVTGETVFIDPEVLTADFLRLIEVARSHSVLGHAGTEIEAVPQTEAALALASRIAAFTPQDGDADVQLLLRGEAAQGTHLNGEEWFFATEEIDAPDDEDTTAEFLSLPDFIDLLPAHLAEKHAARDGEDEEDEWDAFLIPPDGTITARDTRFDVDPGHKVVTGANLSVNETMIMQAWVDAPVIAVAGDAIRLDVVSQVNVMVGATAPFGGAAALPSQLLNAVSIEFESAFGPDGPPPLEHPGMFPEDWTVVRVSGDLISVNWVKQYVFATDFDRAEITITAAATYIGTGENVIVNDVRLAELGFHYDLILVGGSFITLNVIDQINVLVDIDQVLGAPGSLAIHHAGDNLQYNLAELKQTGTDEMTELQDNFRTALDDMAEGANTISHDVAKDARFEGKSDLKVLYIEGDLIKANIIEQHNFLGDSDQIQLMLDDFLAGGAPVELVSGSNAQLNAARIHDIGLDSEVMVGGEAYSDALIYQAQLMDPDAPPSGVGLVPLANEAVAFLADDMLSPTPETEHGAPPMATDHPASSDLLHAIIT